MIGTIKHLHHPPPPVPTRPRGLRLLLMCTANHPLPSEVARLYGRGVAEGLDVGVVRLEDTFFDLCGVLLYEGPMLVVLCHTIDVSIEMRLAAKQQFLMYGRPCHWLCTVKIGGGPEQSWLAVVAHLSRLSGWGAAAQGTHMGRDRR